MTSLISVNRRCREGDYDIGPIKESLGRLGAVVECDPDSVADCERELRDTEQPVARIVLGGGDGTINRLLPTLVELSLPCGIIPLGTANDFARSLGLSLNPDDAAEPILRGTRRRVDVGDVNGRLFVNAAGIGLGPALTRKLDHDRKKQWGVFAYLVTLVEVFTETPHRTAIMTIDDERYEFPFIQITIANGVHYGGGMKITEDAALDNTCLQVLCLEPQSPSSLLAKLRALRVGAKRDEYREKMSFYSGKVVSVKSSKPTDVTADGELATRTPIVCKILPTALEVFAPLQN